jgi:hypothetical protein
METVCFSETLVSTYKSTRRHNPEQHRHLHHRENLKSHKLDACFPSGRVAKSRLRDEGRLQRFNGFDLDNPKLEY